MVIDPKDRLWILDTGRAAMQNGTNVPASVGGPKLIGVNLQNDTIFKTIVFPPNVVYADSVSPLISRSYWLPTTNTPPSVHQ